MFWLKKFRKKYGISTFHLACFLGESENNVSVMEYEARVPEKYEKQIREIKDLFESLDLEDLEEDKIIESRHTIALQKDLVRRIEKNEEYLKRLLREKTALVIRYRQFLLYQKVVQVWSERKKDSDPDLKWKKGGLEVGEDFEMKQCGPAAQSSLQIKIAEVEASLVASKKELSKYLPDTNP